MNLHSPLPYWLLKHGIINSYPSLHADLHADVVVMGAGISGALVAHELCKAGFDTIILDRRHTGTGSTAASTALLQYEIDTPLHELIGLVGERHATRSYLLCLQAIDEIEKICEGLPQPGLFTRRPSLQFASFIKDMTNLEKEYRLRKKAGISLQLLYGAEVKRRFGFKKPGGLLSRDGAEADAYLITHGILAKYSGKGLRVFDNTEVVRIHHHKRSVELLTAEGRSVRAKYLVIACGYESQQYIPKQVQQLHSTYAIASEPYPDLDFWYKNALIWETQTPYLYLRTTSDKRIIIGGKDTPFTSPRKRDGALSRKTRELESSFKKLFPMISFKTDFKWVGNFASTKDGLPYIGSISSRPRTYFALGFGGNGITFSQLASRIIVDDLNGKKNKDGEIFSFNR